MQEEEEEEEDGKKLIVEEEEIPRVVAEVERAEEVETGGMEGPPKGGAWAREGGEQVPEEDEEGLAEKEREKRKRCKRDGISDQTPCTFILHCFSITREPFQSKHKTYRLELGDQGKDDDERLLHDLLLPLLPARFSPRVPSIPPAESEWARRGETEG